MGLPEIFINFQTAAVSAITRSARGVLAVALTDATEGGAVEAVYKSLAEVPQEQFTAENYRLLELAFLAAPSKVCVLRVGEDAELTFSLELCVALPEPEKPGTEPPGIMQTLNLGV